MGYTHYWTFKSIRGQAARSEKSYQNGIKQCIKVVQAYSKSFGGLAGYTAHDVSKRYGGIQVNGSNRVGACEEFSLREHLNQNEASFCKTNRYQYDTVVTACLIIMSHYMKSQIEIGSDGYRTDWADGLILAQKVTRINTLQIPVSIREKPHASPMPYNSLNSNPRPFSLRGGSK